MDKKNLFTIIGAVIFLQLPCLLLAQKTTTQKPVAKPTTPAVLPDTAKIPVFTTKFGPFNGTAPVFANDVKRSMAIGLSVTDQQGQKWTPLSWLFTWNRQEQSDDIRTGKRKTILTSNMVEVDSSGVLPLSWQNEINEFLKSGEEVIFEKIIVEHPGSKRKRFAPDLRIKVI